MINPEFAKQQIAKYREMQTDDRLALDLIEAGGRHFDKEVGLVELRGRQQSTDRPEQHNTLINPVLPMRADSVKSFRVLTDSTEKYKSRLSAHIEMLEELIRLYQRDLPK